MSIKNTILGDIVARKFEEVAQLKRRYSEQDLLEQIRAAQAVRPFVKAVASTSPAVIAEIKKASPSKGVIRENFNPAEIAVQYQTAGAACLSVLTDVDFFQGSNDYLLQARAACQLPVLRKDFMVDTHQILESRAIHSDCILLIAACLTDSQMHDMYSLATELGMDALIEVHDHAELDRALKLPAKLIGINNRNLKSFAVTLDTTIGLRQYVPTDRILVTESGISSAADVALMQSNNVNAFLVGESFMREANPAQAFNTLFGQPQRILA